LNSVLVFEFRQETIMTAALYDEVVTVASAPKLTVVRDVSPAHVPAPKKVARRLDSQTLSTGGDPLVDGAARLLSVPLRHVYAALWRVGVLEVQA
jgi:hypothetical protein